MPNDMLNAFDGYFEVVIANTPELLEQAFRLRYTVLCIGARQGSCRLGHAANG